MRPSTRFEVFKRDGFACQYCGRRTPDVVLECDHIIPRAEGGSDEIENLVTACWDCNRGKGARLLDDRAPTPDIAEQAELIREREAQLRALHAEEEARVERRQAGLVDAWNYWFELWGVETLKRWETPYENPLRSQVETLGLAVVKEAMDIAYARCSSPSQAAKYFGGIMRRKLAEREGRVVLCKYCGESIVLDRGEDTTTEWWHTRCAPGATS